MRAAALCLLAVNTLQARSHLINIYVPYMCQCVCFYSQSDSGKTKQNHNKRTAKVFWPEASIALPHDTKEELSAAEPGAGYKEISK